MKLTGLRHVCQTVRSAASWTSTSISLFAVALFVVMVVVKIWVDPGATDEPLSVVPLKVKLGSAGMVAVGGADVAIGGAGVAIGVVVVEPFNA